MMQSQSKLDGVMAMRIPGPVSMRLTTAFAALISLLVHAAPAAAQSGALSGVVMDESGEPLPGVNVFIVGTTLGAASRVDGTFRIDGVPAGTHTVAASAVGYERATREVTVAAGEEVDIEFRLVEIALQSGEVVVTATRGQRLTGGVAASVSTITTQEIAARHVVELDDALRYVSGVQMAGNQINIRGSSGFSFNTGSRVLLLLDGSPMLRPDVNGIPYDHIPMSQVERIEVLKGPGSALYGGGALGGVINVLTRDYPATPETSISFHAGAYQPVRYAAWREKWDEGDELKPHTGISIGHARPLGRRTGIWAHVAYRYNSGYLRLDEERHLQVYTKVTHRFTRESRLSILSGVTRRKADNFIFWNGLSDPLNPGVIDFGRASGSSGSDDNLINEWSLLPSYSQVLTPDWLLTARARVFGVLIQPLDEFGNPRPLSRGTVGLRYGGEAQVDFTPTPRRTITFGATGDANAARSSYFAEEGDLRQPEGAVYVQWEETVRGGLTTIVGLRYDAYRVRSDLVSSKLSPRVSASYAFTESWIVRAAYAEGFRVPSVLERFVSNTDYLPLVSNLDLRPETSRSYEIGLRAFPRIHRLSAAVDGAVFWSDYWRLIEPTFVTAERAFQFVNLTRARVRGAEITADVATRDNVAALKLGYTYLDARDLSIDEPLVFRSRHLLQVGGTIEVARARFGADLRIASEPERVDSDFAAFVKDAERMAPVRVVDLRLGYHWRWIEASMHVENALDYYYVERPALLAPPRQFILKVSATF